MKYSTQPQTKLELSESEAVKVCVDIIMEAVLRKKKEVEAEGYETFIDLTVYGDSRTGSGNITCFAFHRRVEDL